MKQRRLVTSNISAKIKQLREERDLSMRELADRAGLSASLVCKIEAGRVSPTVMSLEKLLDAMDMGLHEFFNDEQVENPADKIAFKASDMVVAEDEEHLWCYAFPKHPDIKGQLTYEEYRPHTRLMEKERHRGDICGFVLSGELTIDITDRDSIKLSKGDAFYIKAGQQHMARNDGEKSLKLVVVQFK
ncbi:MAG: cupin domain-containing protein [Armatimonadota bacterium]